MQNRQNIAKIINDCKVAPAQLKKYSDSSILPKSTKLAPNLDLNFGQDRAVHALQTACAIKATGYHVFAAGENGLGKRTFIQHYLHQYGVPQAPLVEWVYVANFKHPQQPVALALGKGDAQLLTTKLTEIWQQLYLSLSQKVIDSKSTTKIDANITINTDAKIANTNTNISPKLVNTEQTKIAQLLLIHAHHYAKPLFTDLYNTFAHHSKLINYLQQLQKDMLNEVLVKVLTDTPSLSQLYQLNKAQQQQECGKKKTQIANTPFSLYLPEKYHLQTMLKHPESQQPDPQHKVSQHGAPIVFVPNPSLANLFGRIYCNQTNNVTSKPHTSSDELWFLSDHHNPNQNQPQNPLIQAGALHQANGGYLLIEAHQLNDYPDAWRALKLALRSNQIDFDYAQQHRSITTQPNRPLITPEPIPLAVKVILLGDPDLYDMFADQDVDFTSLFKIRADFHPEVARTAANERQMSAKLADIIDKYQINHFDADAQAVVLEYLSLQSEDQNKLSLHADSLIQLMLEASRHADLEASHSKKQRQQLVNATHVKQALSDMIYRSSYLKELYLQDITDGQQLISTSGTAIGQINALTIIDYANSEFGMPALLTAVVQNSVGSGDILDIERDVELGGSLHAKGMLIMNSYLRALFSPYYPLNFTASLAFEQSYAHIDGDSATLAEACALLSALAETPISQELGITGSMNQLGRVQAVGGINTKVAGFFDACVHQGLTGNQGVILPIANISQLMLRDDIIMAVKAGKFHVYGVKTLSDALTILANKSVDSKNKHGHYRKSSLFGKIITNLQKWEEQLNPPEQTEEASNCNTSTIPNSKPKIKSRSKLKTKNKT